MLVNHGRRVELDLRDGNGAVGLSQARITTGVKLSSYCTVQEVGKEILILFETANRMYDEYIESRELAYVEMRLEAMENNTLTDDPDHPLNSCRDGTSWETVDAEYAKGRHEIMRTFGRFKSLMEQRLEPGYHYKKHDMMDTIFREVRTISHATCRRDMKFSRVETASLIEWRHSGGVQTMFASLATQMARQDDATMTVLKPYMKEGEEFFAFPAAELWKAWMHSYRYLIVAWISEIDTQLPRSQQWYYRAMRTALESSDDILVLNVVHCNLESDSNLISWWEPVKETPEDREKHLHDTSVQGESGILLRPDYKHRSQTEGRGAHECFPLQHKSNTSRNEQLIWDTGSTCFVHRDDMQGKETNIRECDETFCGFGEGGEQDCTVKATLCYDTLTVPTSYRVPGARSNLAAGWTSRLRGIGTYIDGSNGTSFIQLKDRTRLKLVNRGSQPIVGKVIKDKHPLEMGWMGEVVNGTVSTVIAPDGRRCKIKSPKADSVPQESKLNQGGRKKVGDKSSKKLYSLSNWKDEAMNTPESLQGKVAIDLCGGMSCLAMGLKETGNSRHFSRYISVDKDPKKREVAQVANPKSKYFCGIDHDWCSDVWLIQEADIKAFGYNGIGMLGCGPNCQPFSRLLFLPDRNGNLPEPGVDPRPGLNSKKGRIFRKCIQIWKWVMKYNPRCLYLFENVEFRDMPDWKQVCRVLGEPMLIQSRHFSFTSRYRSYWTNIPVPKEGLQRPSGLMDPNTCMDPGRKLVLRKSKEFWTPGTIGAHWKGDPNKPEADTGRPVLVRDERFDEDQHLLPQEAEQLMGMKKDVTKASSLTAKDRLRAIGDAWDMNVVRGILRQCKFGLPQAKRSGHISVSTKTVLVARGMGPKRLHNGLFIHGALGHQSPTTMELIYRHKVIEDMPKLPWADIDPCISCDKGKVTMPFKTKKKPEEYLPLYPMQHLYCDAGCMGDEDSVGGLKYFIAFREAPAQLRGCFAVTNVTDAYKCLRSFLEEHFQQVTDRRAMEKRLLKIKPDGEQGAFGKEFQKVASEYGYQLDPSMPGCPDENQAEWCVNEFKRKSLILLEENCLPLHFFPLAMKYMSQISCMMPSRSHEKNVSPYQYVTGKTPHIKEFIPFCTLGWKPRLKQDRKALRWRGTPVVFLAWDSLYRRKGKIVLSLKSLIVQRAKMEPRHFVFGKSWKNFVADEELADFHREAIKRNVTETECQTGNNFEKHMRDMECAPGEDQAPAVPLTDIELNLRTRDLIATDVSNYRVGTSVQVFFHPKSLGDSAGWYNGEVRKIEGSSVEVFYEEDGTFSEHNLEEGQVKTVIYDNLWRKHDSVSYEHPEKGVLKGMISKVKPDTVTIKFKDKCSNVSAQHDDKDLARVNSCNLSNRQEDGYGQQSCELWEGQLEDGQQCTVEHIEREFGQNRSSCHVDVSQKCMTKAFNRMLLTQIEGNTEGITEKEREKILSDGMDAIVASSEDKDEIECSVSFSEDTGHATLIVENGIGTPAVPKGFGSIQYIDDEGVREKWYEAIRVEHQKSEDNGTFQWISDKEMEVLKKMKVPILRHVWVFKLKRDESGVYSIYKARGCVDGSGQKLGVDYNETFAPTCREDTLKVLISLAVANKWKMNQMDVTSAFTNASLDEDVYMYCPRGIKGKTRVAKLLRALYGLKQSPRQWYLDLLKNLQKEGWIRCGLDACLFRKWVENTASVPSSKDGKVYKGTWIYMLVYVDDLFMVTPEDYAIQYAVAFFKRTYKMTDMGWPKDFLAFELEFGIDEATKLAYCIMHQSRYVHEILERYKVEGRPALSPWEHGSDLTASDQAEDGWTTDFPYREFCGSVIYLRTRPDVSYTVSKLCKWMTNPGPKMILAAKRLLRYLREFPEGGISFGINHFSSENEGTASRMQELFNSGSLYGNTDSSYGDEKDHCWSTMGQILMLNGGPVHQKSYEYKAQIKQLGETLGEASVMTSTVQAEYVALSNGAREQMAFSELLDFFRESIEDTTSYGLEGPTKVTVKNRSDMAQNNEFENHPAPLSIFGDNEGSIRITKKREMTKLAKHIGIKHHHIRDLYENGCIVPEFVGTHDQIADVLTKGLLPADHLRCCRKFMVLPDRKFKSETPIHLAHLVFKRNRYGYSPW